MAYGAVLTQKDVRDKENRQSYVVVNTSHVQVFRHSFDFGIA